VRQPLPPGWDNHPMSNHPFADRWNHNTHHYPRLRAGLPASARRHLDIGCGEGTLCRYVAETGRVVTGVDVDDDALAADVTWRKP
jgi:2-polyprenyl-3-methyl-5-hydroxy-6-metoxy-1,4-benzoquinol methylase